MICGENRESASSLVYGQSRGTFRAVWGQLRFVAGQRRMPRERIAQHLSERAPTDAGSHVNRPPSLASTPIQFCASRGWRILDLEDVMYQ